MNKPQDHYNILGVKYSASHEEIREAYWNLARIYHPDRNPGNSESEFKLKQLNAAYAVLGDTDKRRTYDLLTQGPTNDSRSTPPNPPNKNNNQQNKTYTKPHARAYESNNAKSHTVIKEEKGIGGPILGVCVVLATFIAVTICIIKSSTDTTTNTNNYVQPTQTASTTAQVYAEQVPQRLFTLRYGSSCTNSNQCIGRLTCQNGVCLGPQGVAGSETLTDFQQYLISLGYDLGPNGADGVYGKLTQNAWHLCYMHNQCSNDAPSLN